MIVEFIFVQVKLIVGLRKNYNTFCVTKMQHSLMQSTRELLPMGQLRQRMPGRCLSQKQELYLKRNLLKTLRQSK